MSNELTISHPRQIRRVPGQAMTRPASREDYFTRPRPDNLHGRLGYGGKKPGIVGCEIFQISDSSAYVETYTKVEFPPPVFTLEVNGQYHRARFCYAEKLTIRLEFFSEELDYIETD